MIAGVACGPAGDADPGGGSGTPEPEPEAPSPYVAPEAEAPVATADLAEIEAAAQAALDGARALSGRPVQAAYDAAMVGQQGSCPSYYANDYGTYWYDTCTSELGTTFSGYAFAYAAVEVFDPTSAFYYTYWTIYGGATVFDDANLLELSGSAYYLDGWSGDGNTMLWESSVQGTFSYDGAVAADTWLAGAGSDPDLYQYALRLPMVNANYLLLEGGYSGFGDVGWAASFARLELMDGPIGTTCPEEPGGSMAIRAGDGGWYDVLFHGATDQGPADDARCDGCGDVFYEGEKIGSACVEVETALHWTGAPW